MNSKAALSPIIERWNLLNHPFYQAWSAGTLPESALRAYAAEYGNFIALLADGWDKAGNASHAAEEREHADLWATFTRALGSEVTTPCTEGVKNLLSVAASEFADKDGVWGALYAFEVQQPATAASKLKGLQNFYALPNDAHRYFEVHANDLYEADMIEAILDKGQHQQARVAAACERVCEAMWNALSGFHHEAC